MRFKTFFTHALLICFTLQLLGSHVLAADNTENLKATATQAYVYAFPMVLMEITRRVSTHHEEGKSGGAEMNKFSHARAFPDHTFTDVVRPNADTLYSNLWFDVSQEPLILDIADTGGRYFMLPILDMWTDIVAVPGSRTTGTGSQTYGITGPDWQGTLPDGIEPIRCPTGTGWIIGRTQTNGKADYDTVHKIQAGYTITPLSRWEKPAAAISAEGEIDSAWDIKTPPLDQVLNMKAGVFFQLFAELLKENPPHEMDWNIFQQCKTIGLEFGKSFDAEKLSGKEQQTLELAVADAKKIISQSSEEGLINGWSVSTDFIGVYGTSYRQRAHIAMIGLGANIPEDAVYPIIKIDDNGDAFNGSHKYVLHFNKDELPQVSGFWSLTMYNEKMLFADNPIQRYAIGDRDDLRFNEDGSLDIFIQHASPGSEQESNWLPAPAGNFDMTLRLYWPSMDILTGAWKPPAVKRLD